MKHHWLIILSSLLAFNVNANVIKKTQLFLQEVNNHKGFWFYNRGTQLSKSSEQAFLNVYQGQKDFLFCNAMDDKRVIFKTLIKTLKFANEHALLIFIEQKNTKREQMVRRFAREYQLPLMMVHNKQNKFLEISRKLNASAQDVFLINPHKRQIRLVSRAHHDCWLEEEFFLDVYQYLEQKRGMI
jgi:hypothetical protein